MTRIRQKDLRIGTWNVRSLAIPGAVDALANELEKKNMDIVALQETRWPLAGKLNTKEYVIYYSGNNEGRYYGGVGFAIRKKWSPAVISFNPINQRMCNIRIKSRFRNMSLISIYAPTEEAEEDEKDMFYESLEELVTKLPNYDLKIILGDANAKLGKEDMWKTVSGKQSLHDVSNNNGVRLLSFCESTNYKVMSTAFPHKKIHKETWVSPNGLVKNQIDHVLIEQRHKTSILDVHSLRGAECGSDHYLVLVKVKQRIAVVKSKGEKPCELSCTEKLKRKEVVEEFRLKLLNRFEALDEVAEVEGTINEQWGTLKSMVQETVKEVCGKRNKVEKKPWFDKECKDKVEERLNLKKIWLREQTEESRILVNRARNETSKLLRKKKRQHISSILEKAETNNITNPRDFYKIVNMFKKGYKPKSYGVKVNGEVITEGTRVLEVWRDYFENLLNGEERNQVSSETQIYQTAQPKVESPSLQEVIKAIKEMKNHKAPGNDGITSEILKAGGMELATQLHKLIDKIWEKEEMPTEWEEAIVVPIHKKGDKEEPKNYRGISLLSTPYKILSKIIQRRLEVYAEEIIEDHQAGFQRGRSTTDQIYILKETIAKYWEFNKEFYGLFVDFRKAYDSLIRERMWKKMEHFGIPTKLINMANLSVKNSKCKVRVENEYSPLFAVNTGVRQGDNLSPLLFNLALEGALKEIKKTRLGIHTGTTIGALAFADDVALIAETKEDLNKLTGILIQETLPMGLQINEEKTKLVHFGRGNNNRENFITMNYNFEQVNEFKYLGTLINSKNDEHIEVQSRVNLAN